MFKERNYKKVKRQVTEWKKILVMHITDKKLLKGLYKALLQINKPKTDYPKENVQKK